MQKWSGGQVSEVFVKQWYWRFMREVAATGCNEFTAPVPLWSRAITSTSELHYGILISLFRASAGQWFAWPSHTRAVLTLAQIACLVDDVLPLKAGIPYPEHGEEIPTRDELSWHFGTLTLECLGELSKLFLIVKCSDYLRPNRKWPPQQNSVDLISLAHCGLWAVRCNGRAKITKSLPVTKHSTSTFAFPYSCQTYTEERQKVWKWEPDAFKSPFLKNWL